MAKCSYSIDLVIAQTNETEGHVCATEISLIVHTKPSWSYFWGKLGSFPWAVAMRPFMPSSRRKKIVDEHTPYVRWWAMGGGGGGETYEASAASKKANVDSSYQAESGHVNNPVIIFQPVNSLVIINRPILSVFSKLDWEKLQNLPKWGQIWARFGYWNPTAWHEDHFPSF